MESEREVLRHDHDFIVPATTNDRESPSGASLTSLWQFTSDQHGLTPDHPRDSSHRDMYTSSDSPWGTLPDSGWCDVPGPPADQSGQDDRFDLLYYEEEFDIDKYLALDEFDGAPPISNTWPSNYLPHDVSPGSRPRNRPSSDTPLPKINGHRSSLSEGALFNPKNDPLFLQTEIPPGLDIPSFTEVQASIKRKRREAKYFNPQYMASFAMENSQMEEPSTSSSNTYVVREMQENAENGADDPEQIKGELCVAEATNQLRLCDPGVSHLADPTEWMRCNKEHVINIARNLLSLEITVGDIYPRLTVYTLAHMMFSTKFSDAAKHAKIVDLLEVIESWKAWDDVFALANHQIVKNRLLTCLKPMHQIRGTSHHDLVDSAQTALAHILHIDAISTDALLLMTLQDRVSYRQLVRRRGQEAQNLLNLLQARLQFPLDPSLRRFHLGALIKLSRFSGLYPECMILKGIGLAGKVAVDFGGYGDIWKGLLAGKEIAVKVLRILGKFEKDKFLKDFSSEAVIWRQLNHPNVLPFYGVFHLEDDRLCLASPWMNNGNVVRFLESFPDTKCVPLMLDIALGINYLHTFKPSIIHGDIKGVNILITQSLRACLADFGLAAAKETQSMAVTSAVITRATGTMRWQAPELLQDDDVCNSLASDIYAYACVCYELFSGKLPFHDIQKDFRVMSAVMKGERPLRPSDDRCRIRGLYDEIWNIIETCWAQEPNDRPSAGQIVEHLSSLSACTDGRHDGGDGDSDFDPTFPSRTLYAQAEHPFSAFAYVEDDD